MTRYLFTCLLLFSISINSQSLDSLFQNAKFRSIGPFKGGRSVAVSGVNGNPLNYYTGSTGGGLWKTTDAGISWENISDGFFEMGSVGAIAVSESHPNIVYCGMGEHAPRGVMTSYGNGVYKSTNAGKTWKHIGLPKTHHISRIQIHPTNPNIVFVGAQGQLYGPNEERGIFKSIDGGKTWKKILYINNLTGCSELSMDMNDPEVIYASMWEHQRKPWKIISGGDGSGIYKSIDGGESWTQLKKGLPRKIGKSGVSVSRANSDKIYAIVEADWNKEKGGLYVSNDAGKTWSQKSKEHRLIQRAWYYTKVFADPLKDDVVYVLSASAYGSKDGGKTWNRISANHGDYHDLWINPKNSNNLVIANDGGGEVSFNTGKSWSGISQFPIAQIYRLNTDNQYPYHVYSGQQDFPSFRIPSANLSGFTIGKDKTINMAGGESAFLAFNRDDPRYVMGGSYQGTVEVLDTETDVFTDVMAAPIQYLGKDAKDMKYRFNWNAPIICSVHDPNVFYHASHKLLKTTNKGISWEEVSPDLTKNQIEKQGKPGGPFTNEAVGAETYGTISYVVESKKNKGELWVATDDGLVQLTKDGGKTWTNITPKGLKECLVNTIDLSEHKNGVAYIATTRYKFNDLSPSLYKTENYGKSWKKISEGIPYSAFTRVVREDKKQQGLLLAGTEKGIYVSFNDGKQWKPFKLNIPNTPINDLKLEHDNIQVGTSGRGIWIFDDLHLLRSYKANTSTNKAQLFVEDATNLGEWRSHLSRTTSSFKGAVSGSGVNPAYGAVIYYTLPKLADSTHINITIKDQNGKLVRNYSSKKNKTFKSYPSGPSQPTTLTKEQGILNRVVWNLSYPNLIGAPEVYIEGGYYGHQVMPGTYNITLKAGNETTTKNIRVEKNPMLNIPNEDYKKYDGFMLQMTAVLNDMHTKVNTLHTIEKQLKLVVGKLKDKELKAKGKALIKKINTWDGTMVQRMSKAYDDVENFENKLSSDLLFLIGQSRNAMRKITEPSKKQFEEIKTKWQPLKLEAKALLESEIPKFNKTLWNSGIGALDFN